ncbi:hypothetical protein SB00175_03703 [Klebsiella oxytoca]|nr:hypothetical protein SB00175_03703 [Klebsiella oxytoca]
MVSSTVFVCQLVVIPFNHDVLDTTQLVGLFRSEITPTESEDIFDIASEDLNSNVTVNFVSGSTGMRVWLATRMEPVVVLSAFSPASYVNAEPVPESTHSERSDSIPPLAIRLPDISDA